MIDGEAGKMGEEKEPKQLDGQQEPDPRAVRKVHLPALISDEFGVSRSVARMEIELGKIEIDGEEYAGDKLDLPYSEIVGKTITVKGRDRGFKLNYQG